jgi:gamma-glutamylcyclotransferase (GGCT)/AIG2-like uncharacterized protein YtfP
MLSVFVYGTLKRGGRYHARYCPTIIDAEPAAVWGRLYHLPQGYPMLEVPPETILRSGTLDFHRDLAAQTRLASQSHSASLKLAEPWRRIEGEVLRFPSAEALALLDELEGFLPEAAGLYDRVLVPTLSPNAMLVWTYIAPGGRIPHGAREIGSHWPEMTS